MNRKPISIAPATMARFRQRALQAHNQISELEQKVQALVAAQAEIDRLQAEIDRLQDEKDLLMARVINLTEQYQALERAHAGQTQKLAALMAELVLLRARTPILRTPKRAVRPSDSEEIGGGATNGETKGPAA